MKKIKIKWIPMNLLIVMVFGASACGTTSNSSTKFDKENPTPTPSPTTTPTTTPTPIPTPFIPDPPISVKEACEALGMDLGSFDMEIGAGQADIPMKTRGQKINIDLIGSTPIILNQANTEYVLMTDVAAPLTAFEIKASGVTLNLNGHQITYGTGNSADGESYGVLINGYMKDALIANGSIIQGGGNCSGTNRLGCNPIRGLTEAVAEIGGLYIEWHAADASAIPTIYANGLEVHHNTIVDKGFEITNRHSGVPTIPGAANAKIHHNLVREARHRVFDVGNGSEIFNNEIYIDSMAVNSYGAMALETVGYEIHHNKVIARGAHPIGFFGGGGRGANGRIYSNYTDTENTRNITQANPEEPYFGKSMGSAGFRSTWGGQNIDVLCNTFVVRAGNDHGMDEWRPEYGKYSWGRAIWTGNIVGRIQNNVVQTDSFEGRSYAPAIAINGAGDSSNLLIEGNYFASNERLISLTDTYGTSANYPKFVENTFVKLGDNPNFNTISSINPDWEATAIFLDNVYSEGSEISESTVDFRMEGPGLHELIFGTKNSSGFDIYFYLTNSSSTISGGSSSVPFENGFRVNP